MRKVLCCHRSTTFEPSVLSISNKTPTETRMSVPIVSKATYLPRVMRPSISRYKVMTWPKIAGILSVLGSKPLPMDLYLELPDVSLLLSYRSAVHTWYPVGQLFGPRRVPMWIQPESPEPPYQYHSRYAHE